MPQTPVNTPSTSTVPKGLISTTQFDFDVVPPKATHRVGASALDKAKITAIPFFFPAEYNDIAEVLRELLTETYAVSVAIYPRRPYSRGKFNAGEHFGLVIVTKTSGEYTQRIYEFNPLLQKLAERQWYPPIHVYTESEAEAVGGIDELARAESLAYKRIYW